jgi:NADH dehydrogenase
VIDALERAAVTVDDDERHALLTFVVVGGGATGVETAAALADLLRQIIPSDYPGLSAAEARVLVVEGSSKLLGHMDTRMAGAALATLRDKGVEVWLNAKAGDVAQDHVALEDGRTVPARTVVWATGVRAPEVVERLDAPHGKGGSLAVNEYLQIEGHPEVFAAGDNAHYEDPQTHQSAPLLAAAAVQMGAAAGENVARAIAGQPLLPFRYHSLGTAVSLGRNAGSAEFGGLVVDGLAGWLVWRAIHLAKITGFQNRLRTALDWSLGYLNESDTARLEMQEAA